MVEFTSVLHQNLSFLGVYTGDNFICHFGCCLVYCVDILIQKRSVGAELKLFWFFSDLLLIPGPKELDLRIGVNPSMNLVITLYHVNGVFIKVESLKKRYFLELDKITPSYLNQACSLQWKKTN